MERLLMQIEYKFRGWDSNFENPVCKIQRSSNLRGVVCTLAKE